MEGQERLKSALADRYRLEREIGSGGMATVYLAQDLRHDRLVAIKVLKPELAQSLGADRFLREIKIAAKLSHPHILPLFDSGQAEDSLYYVMPYVEGESLRDRLTRERQLPIEDALLICHQVADALSYAHDHGVIHRDIKPENVLLQGGHAVVADFGIARAINQAGGDTVTGTGVALGTPAYMSPEQAVGSKEVDGRSDLYSLGCVLYEMLAGQAPFAGARAESMIYQHLSAEPPNVSVVRPTVPSSIAAALTRTLAKTPADRFYSASAFVAALGSREFLTAAPRAPGGTVRAVGRPYWMWLVGGAVVVGAVAVAMSLFSGGSEVASESGADGLPARRPWVIVADFDGTADPAYRRTARDLVSMMLDQSTVVATLPADQVGRALVLAGRTDTTVVTEALARELAVRAGVGSVVAGQVDRVGSSYSVRLRLMSANSGEVVEAQSVTAGSDDALIPAIEETVRAFRAGLGERRAVLDASAPMPEVMTPSFAAYQKYMEAERLWFASGDKRAARDVMREALVLDPDFASAWLFLGLDPATEEEWQALNEARRRPSRLTSAERLRLEWMISFTLWHLSVALPLAEQRLRERPNDFISWVILGLTTDRLRGPEAHIEVLDGAADLDPFKASLFSSNRTGALIRAGRRAEGRQAAQGIRDDVLRLGFLLDAAVLDGAWAEVDSLAPLWERAYLEQNGEAAGGSTWRTVRHLVRGEVRAAEAERATARGADLPLLYELATASPVTRTDTSWAGAFEAALGGDTAAAWSALPGLTADSLDYRAQSGYWSAALEAAIAWRRGDWNAVVRDTGPIRRDRPRLGSTLGTGVVWLTAHAYERLDRPDSAVVLLGELVEPGPTWGSAFEYGAAQSYLRQHLIVLLAGMGRMEEARRHWQVFQETFTNPDPEVAHLVDEARAALDAAGR